MVVPPEWKQVLYTFGVHVNMISLGMVMAYSGTLLPALKDPGSQIKIDDKMQSWIAAMPGVSGVIPTVLLGPLMHYGGRKKANYCLLIPVLFGWILTFFAGQFNSISMLLTGRFFQGLCLGSPYFISVCIGEFSSPKMRSMLLCTKPVCGMLGISLMHFMAYFLEWKYLALVGTAPPTLGLLITVYWPDTPEWLVSRGRYEEATIAFSYIRGYSEEGDRELRQLIESDKMRQSCINNLRNDFWTKVKSRVLWKPVGVLFFTVLVPTMGGRQFIPAYSVDLCAQLSGDKSKGYFYTVMGDVIGLIAVCSSFYLVKSFKRRQLLFGSGLVGIVLLGTSSFLCYIRTIYASKLLARFTLFVFGTYYFVSNAGFIPVSYMLMGEIFPLEYRAIGSVIDGILATGYSTTVVAILPIMERSLGMHGVLLIFGSFMLVCFLYLYYELPETKNRTLHDIGDYFRGKSPKIRKEEDIVVTNEENRSIIDEHNKLFTHGTIST